MELLSFNKFMVVGAFALTTACSSGPIDAYDTCVAALDGVADPVSEKLRACQRDVSFTAWQSGHAAAQKYRDMAR